MMKLNSLPYDIVDKVINYLDVDSTRNLLLSSKALYSLYAYHSRFQLIMTKKYINYFPSLTKLQIDTKKYNQIQICEFGILMTKIYNYFKHHNNASLPDFLVYLCDGRLSNTLLFELMVSHCYFTKTGEYIYNAIRADDLLYLLTFSKDVQTLLTYIYVDPVILLHSIKYRISTRDDTNFKHLFKYLLFKHFFRYSEYIEDIVSEIVCEVIKYDRTSLLKTIYDKQDLYKFRLNYQMIITCCIQQKTIDYLELINIKMKEQNQRLRASGRGGVLPVMITKEHVRSLMKSKSYKMLERIINLYLKDVINIYGYVNEIINNFDTKNTDCLQLLKYLNDKNKNLIKHLK